MDMGKRLELREIATPYLWIYGNSVHFFSKELAPESY